MCVAFNVIYTYHTPQDTLKEPAFWKSSHLKNRLWPDWELSQEQVITGV